MRTRIWSYASAARAPLLAVFVVTACRDVVAPTVVPSPASTITTDDAGIFSNQWTILPSLTQARLEHGVVSYNSCVWAIGGRFGALKATDKVETYCPSGAGGWTSGPSLPEARSRLAGIGVIDGRIYVAGGIDALGNARNTLFIYSPVHGWLLSPERLPFSIACGASAVVGRRLYVYGWKPITQGVFSDDCSSVFEPVFAVYDAARSLGHRWRTLPAEDAAPNVYFGRCLHSMTSLDSTLYVFGGTPDGCGVFFTPLADVGAFDTRTERWTTIVSPDEGRHAPTAAAVNGRLYVMGGQNGDVWWDPTSEVKVYDPSVGAWDPMHEGPFQSFAGAAILGSRIIVPGGAYPFNWIERAGTYQLVTSNGCDPHEPDGSAVTANPWILRGDAEGTPLKPYRMQLARICAVNDVDYFLITRTYWSDEFDVVLTPPTGADYQLELLNARGTDVLRKSALVGDVPETVSAPADERQYLVRVKSQNGSFDKRRAYTLVVR